MLRTEKETKVRNLEVVLERARGIYLADFKGMSVEVISELRKRCRESEVRFEVVKNTLLRRAATAAGQKDLLGFVAGPTAIATSEADEIAPARILMGFQREFKLPEIKGGLVEGRIHDAEQVKELANLPSHEQLLSILLSTLQGTLTGFARVLRAPLCDLARALDRVAEQKGPAS
jgi:large subunit ribosomal protein L10